MIRGWQDGLPGMRVGGKRRLTVPPDLGYGSRPLKNAQGVVVIPPDSTLEYDIDLLGIVPSPSPEP
jgi:FKBP-type peptidyl-prolyl cis-trans isomerase